MFYYKIDLWSHKTNKSSNKRTNKLKQHIQMVINNKNEKKIFLTKKVHLTFEVCFFGNH